MFSLDNDRREMNDMSKVCGPSSPVFSLDKDRREMNDMSKVCLDPLLKCLV